MLVVRGPEIAIERLLAPIRGNVRDEYAVRAQTDVDMVILGAVAACQFTDLGPLSFVQVRLAVAAAIGTEDLLGGNAGVEKAPNGVAVRVTVAAAGGKDH